MEGFKTEWKCKFWIQTHSKDTKKSSLFVFARDDYNISLFQLLEHTDFKSSRRKWNSLIYYILASPKKSVKRVTMNGVMGEVNIHGISEWVPPWWLLPHSPSAGSHSWTLAPYLTHKPETQKNMKMEVLTHSFRFGILKKKMQDILLSKGYDWSQVWQVIEKHEMY